MEMACLTDWPDDRGKTMDMPNKTAMTLLILLMAPAAHAQGYEQSGHHNHLHNPTQPATTARNMPINIYQRMGKLCGNTLYKHMLKNENFIKMQDIAINYWNHRNLVSHRHK